MYECILKWQRVWVFSPHIFPGFLECCIAVILYKFNLIGTQLPRLCRIELSNPDCLTAELTDTLTHGELDSKLRLKWGNGYFFLHICFIKCHLKHGTDWFYYVNHIKKYQRFIIPYAFALIFFQWITKPEPLTSHWCHIIYLLPG